MSASISSASWSAGRATGSACPRAPAACSSAAHRWPICSASPSRVISHGGAETLRARGLGGAPLVAYTSTQAHASVGKAVELLGLGREALRAIPVDHDHRLDLKQLAQRIAEDSGAGKRPFAVVATAGSVNTGAFDDLEAVADICAREGLWLHVDGAFGALVRLSPELKPLARGIERADSLAFDFHKWLHVPYDAGCVLVRDQALMRATFGGRPDYLANVGGISGGEPWPSDLGIELSRGFRALKVWWTIKEQGTRAAGSGDRAQLRAGAAARRDRSALNPHIIIAAPAVLNIVCFRWIDPRLDGPALDALNAEIVVAMQIEGTAVASTTRLERRTLHPRLRHQSSQRRRGFRVCFVETVDSIGAPARGGRARMSATREGERSSTRCLAAGSRLAPRRRRRARTPSSTRR